MKPTGRRGFALVCLRVAFLLISSIGFSFAGDFSFCSVGKGIYYDQTGGGNPVFKTPFPYLLHLELLSDRTTTVFVDVKPPTGFDIHLMPPNLFDNVYSFWRRSTNDAAFLDGDYVFKCTSFSHLSEPEMITNSLVSGTFPSIPTISNLSEAQSVNSSNDFTLTWNAFINGTVEDYISLEILRDWTNAFATPRIGTAGTLAGTASSVTIPAGTLSPGRAYIGRLVFAKTVGTSTNEAIGAGGASFLFSQTDFWIKTQGAGEIITPRIVSTTPPSGQTNVPPNMPITVYFNKPMSTSFSISEIGSGNGSSGGYVENFSPDGMQLVITPLTPYYPQGPFENMIFNPLGHSLAFRDIDGNPLPPDTFVLSYRRYGGNITPIQAVLEPPKIQTGDVVDIAVHGDASFSYALEYSTNLVQWFPLKTNVVFGGVTHFTDTNSLPIPMRFYRAVPH